MSQLDRADTERHPNVRAWLKTVSEDRLYVSAITVMEAWKGFASERKRCGSDAAKLAACGAYEHAFRQLVDAFHDRVIPIDGNIAALWGELIGQQDKNRFDLCVAATARAHDLVVATRNVTDFAARGARVIDPFHRKPRIRTI